MQMEVNAVDLAFIVDTTGSMGNLIRAAQQQMITMMQELAGAASIHLQLGVVEYRDHPPQDRLVYRVHGFTDTLSKARSILDGLRARGGGDAPEAVLDGIVAACRELRWRRHARRMAVLVGDAPPHGLGAGGDAFRQGCPCGETIESVTRLAERTRVTVHALALTRAAAASFREISGLTGGLFFEMQQASEAIERLAALLKSEFSNVELDRQVLALWRNNPFIGVDEVAERVESNRYAVSSSMVRLLSRDLIEVPAGYGST